MGSKTVQTNDPWKPAQPYILQGLQNSGRVFDSTQPSLESYAKDQRDTYGKLAPGAQQGISLTQSRANNILSGNQAGRNPGNSVFRAAANTPRQTNNYIGAVGNDPSMAYLKSATNGDYLHGNPYLQANIDYAINDSNNATNSIFSQGGRYGSGAQQSVLGRNAGIISSNARQADYQNERGLQQQAAGQLSGAYGQQANLNLNALGQDEAARANAQNTQLQAAGQLDANYQYDQNQQDQAGNTAQSLMGGAQSLLNNAADLPYVGVGALNGNVRTASNGYGTQTTTQSGGLGSILGGLAGTLGGAAIGKYSDERVKNVQRQVGTDPVTGLPIYDYTYKGDPTQTPQTGVMAQDVEKVAPGAVSSDPNGIKMVDYGKLGMPDPAELASLKQDVAPIKPYGTGVRGFFNEITQPGSAGIGDTVSRIGESLLAGAGGGWGSIGQGLMAARKDKAQAANDAQEFALKRREADDRGAYYRAQATQKAMPRPPRIIQRRDGSVISIDPETNEQTLISGAIQGPEPLVQVAGDGGQPIYARRSEAAGKPAYVRPLAARGGGGGGVTPTARAKLVGEAEAAIANGAPRAAVYARLAKMGVQ